MAKLGNLAQQLATMPVSPELHNEGRRRFIASALDRPKQRRIGPVQAKLLLAAAAICIAFFGIRLLRNSPLKYEVHGGSRFDSGYLSVANDRPASIQFSDGSSIEASPGTRVRVDRTTPDGARILLEGGKAKADIYHGKTTSWVFVAGPFEVRVLGTAFNLGWDPTKGELDLVLYHGRTEVTSPFGPGSFTVTGGQHFHASLQTRSVRLDEALAANATQTSPPNIPVAIPVQAAPTDANPTKAAGETVSGDKLSGTSPLPANPAKSEPAHRIAWGELARRGEYNSVVEQAKERDVQTCLTSCSIAELRALADSARYVGQPGLAEQSLKAMRRRLSGGEQRAWAAFMLGRIADARGESGKANTWYDTYLAEAPNGQFAADALAGKMQATAQLNGTAVAKPFAMQYLERYPNGVHASTARRIAGTVP
jgi:hypothetical protein